MAYGVFCFPYAILCISNPSMPKQSSNPNDFGSDLWIRDPQAHRVCTYKSPGRANSKQLTM